VRVHEVTLSSVEGKRKGGSFQAHSGASSSTPTPRSGPSPSTVTPPSHLLRRVWLSPDWVHVVGWTGGAVWWCGRWRLAVKWSASQLVTAHLVRSIGQGHLVRVIWSGQLVRSIGQRRNWYGYFRLNAFLRHQKNNSHGRKDRKIVKSQNLQYICLIVVQGSNPRLRGQGGAGGSVLHSALLTQVLKLRPDYKTYYGTPIDRCNACSTCERGHVKIVNCMS
jgi:hypothetical protein